MLVGAGVFGGVGVLGVVGVVGMLGVTGVLGVLGTVGVAGVAGVLGAPGVLKALGAVAEELVDWPGALADETVEAAEAVTVAALPSPPQAAKPSEHVVATMMKKSRGKDGMNPGRLFCACS